MVTIKKEESNKKRINMSDVDKIEEKVENLKRWCQYSLDFSIRNTRNDAESRLRGMIECCNEILKFINHLKKNKHK